MTDKERVSKMLRQSIFLTDRQIAKEFKGGLTMASLMARHGVSQTCIEDSIRKYVNHLNPPGERP